MNPFDLPGPVFLQLYLLVLAVSVVVAFAVRWWMRQPGDDPALKAPELPPYEVAYLAGGERRAIDAAIVSLIKSDVLRIDETNGRLSRRAEMPAADAHSLKQAVFEACDPETGSLLHGVRQKASTATNKLRKRLIEWGLVVSDSQASLVQLVPACIVLAATFFGLIKIFVGIQGRHPVGYLTLLVILSIAGAVVFFVMRPFRSRRGDQALQNLKQKNAALAYSAGPRVDNLAETDLILAVGLFGAFVLAGGPLARIPASLLIPAPKPLGSAGSSGSSCSGWFSSSSSCGGGGGGGGCGGGCGGGGCGGCGGG
jgi:uncharacterized protein (TIGR04222 family)